VNLPARAAAVRGDDFQYTLGWYWACTALSEPGYESVSVEDSGAGSFDDVVVLRHDGNHRYQQAKNSNYSAVVIDEKWLLTASSTKGKSPLRHYYDTWQTLRATGTPTFELITTRGMDANDPLLKLRDVNTNLLMPKVGSLTSGSKEGQALQRWADALKVTTDDLLLFLSDFQVVTTDNERAWRERTKPLMRLAGLKHDDAAVVAGVDIVRQWVKTGAGPRTPDDIRAAAATAGLLAQDGRVVLAVHAIDRPNSEHVPSLKLDWVDLFDGDTDRGRRLLKDPSRWQELAGELREAEKTLASFGVRTVHVEGAMRLPAWFAVGAAFPDTRRWQVETLQRGDLWSSATASAQDGDEAVLGKTSVDAASTDVAVAISLSQASSQDVETYVLHHGIAGTVISITSTTGPGQDSLRDGAHARTWARSARDQLRQELKALPTYPARVHLFLAAPAGAALLLGHNWNLLPPTLVYERVEPTYAPTLEIA
jgi:hypothetical protein